MLILARFGAAARVLVLRPCALLLLLLLLGGVGGVLVLRLGLGGDVVLLFELNFLPALVVPPVDLVCV